MDRVDLDSCSDVETGLFETQAEPSRSGEKVDSDRPTHWDWTACMSSLRCRCDRNILYTTVGSIKHLVLFQKIDDSRHRRFELAQLALPNDESRPTCGAQVF